MDAPPSSHACIVLGGSQAMLRLRCQQSFRAEDGIVAHINGLEVGRLAFSGMVAAGDQLGLPLHRLPRTDLPAAIRCSTNAGEHEIAAPFILDTAAAATALFGPGCWRAEAPRLQHGLLHALLLNSQNGMAEPTAFARINGASARPLQLGRPATLADGTACWPCQLSLLPEDLLEAGLVLALHVAGQEAPLASLAWTRAWTDEADQRLVMLEARLQELEQDAGARLAQLAAEQRHLHAEQRERIDAFIEYAGALLLDRLAGTASRSPDPQGMAPDAGLAALRALVTSAGQQSAPAAAMPDAPARITVGCAAHHLSFGWHQLERDAGGEFRWMGQVGIIANPAPHRPVASVAVELRYVYGAGSPSVQARLDQTTAEVALSDAARLTITPLGGAVPFRSLRLESLHCGSPARDGVSADHRNLSIAVSEVVFCYAN